ncbi:MAG: XRE family transcriptional regulator [Clostridiales bacterium]|nr:XRE family transcriptional regulator [Clostridiales bacterium]
MATSNPESQSAEALSLGMKIRTERLKRRFNLRQLASAAGVTPSLLSQIERGIANPSLKTLRNIANALDVPVTVFFGESISPEQQIVRKHERRRLTSPESDVVYELLSPRLQRQIEFAIMILQPGASSVPEPMSHGGEECALVEGGPVELHLEDTVFELQDGDSVFIPPYSRHRWVNPGKDTVRVIFAVTPPLF